MAAVLVTLTQAKAHLYVTDTSHDTDIQLKLDQAEGIILDYCNSTAWWRVVTATWISPATAPAQVTAAILLMLGRLYEQRGDDEGNDTHVWKAIERLLMRLRDPALA